MSSRGDEGRQLDVGLIEAAVACMPRLTREIFLAHRQDGLSIEETASRMQLSVRQVDWHLARALVLIDRALERRSRRPWWRRWF